MLEDAACALTELEPSLCQAFVAQLSLRSSVLDEVIEQQKADPRLLELVGKAGIARDEDGVIRFHHRVCVPDLVDVREHVLAEAHRSRFSIHPGNTKMYQDLKRSFWWSGMKKDVADYVSRCLICQQVKAERQ